MWAFKAHQHAGPGVKIRFEFSRQSVAVKQYYFYVRDRESGPAFVKIGTYLPYPVWLCLNGHEWVKQQLRRRRTRFLSYRDALALQAVCDALGPAGVQAFFDRWSRQLPWLLRAADRAAGYDHRLAINQLEVSLTQVFDRPMHGRLFFEAVIRENLDRGQPDRVRLFFSVRITRASTPGRADIARA